MKTSVAAGSGVCAAAVLTMIMSVGRTAGYPANLEMMIGTLIGLPPGPVAWLVGLVLHLVVGGGFAVIYAFGFEHLTHRAGATIGAGFALAHTGISGALLGVMPAVHPQIPDTLPAPGAFMSSAPIGAIVFLSLHVIYGTIVGGMYGPVVHRRHAWS